MEQTSGQLALQNKSVSNSLALKDVRIPEEKREKIRKIEKYKQWFYDFFKKNTTQIYSQTTILEGDAVTYLVITSPFNKVEAGKECFPIMGCFPYLGFFKQESALDYEKAKQAEGLFTYQRPVYAYSTLGYFNDTILSSFFHYQDFSLAELIFHELFHTIFFVKDNVELNENLANFFGEILALKYFAMGNDFKQKKMLKEKQRNLLSSEVVRLIKVYQSKLEKRKPEDFNSANIFLQRFLEESFRPKVMSFCQEQKIALPSCFALKRDWNHASFAAFMTYESQGDWIRELYSKRGETPLEFFYYLEQAYEKFSKLKKKQSFEEFLKNS